MGHIPFYAAGKKEQEGLLEVARGHYCETGGAMTRA